jgi:hypothetical protein
VTKVSWGKPVDEATFWIGWSNPVKILETLGLKQHTASLSKCHEISLIFHCFFHFYNGKNEAEMLGGVTVFQKL